MKKTLAKHCAFLTMDSLQNYHNYDALLEQPLARRGWKTQRVSWRDKTIDWNRFDVVLIRSTWDYQSDPALFLKVLQRIQRSSAQLENALALVQWNINKGYLKDLQRAGFDIVPTQWPDKFDAAELAHYFEQLQCAEIVIKPLISANADNTFRLTLKQAQQGADALAAVFEQRPFMLQPFMTSIIDEGEFSLFFFGGEYSHTVLKKPATGDFRVQEEHGGILQKVEPEPDLLALATQLNQWIRPAPLYSRLDFVRSQSGFAIMEIELIEPSLYFNLDAESPERFARAFEQWMAR
ncbi:MAG: hypothetical protein H8E21_07055 [Gammaproteobacteria bacterium]|nr:hypothetical protein [Gammaproteobacteria bacterium]MBL6998810.1 hypothetical protein [Gammaproteobacteria bacterium]